MVSIIVNTLEMKLIIIVVYFPQAADHVRILPSENFLSPLVDSSTSPRFSSSPCS